MERGSASCDESLESVCCRSNIQRRGGVIRGRYGMVDTGPGGEGRLCLWEHSVLTRNIVYFIT